MMILKEFSRIVCVSLFSYQGSCLLSFATAHLLYHIFSCVSSTFLKFFIFSNFKRRRRDLNPRAAINDLLPFQGSPFGQLGYFSKLPYTIVFHFFLPEAFYIISRCFPFVKNFFYKFFILNSGESGIRTHAPLRTNGFQDRLVMTTSISLHMHFSVFYLCISVRRKMYSIINLF